MIKIGNNTKTKNNKYSLFEIGRDECKTEKSYENLEKQYESNKSSSLFKDFIFCHSSCAERLVSREITVFWIDDLGLCSKNIKCKC